MILLYLKIMFVAGFLNLMCTTKVSEWVLLNSPANDYLLVYYHKDQLSELTRRQNSMINNELRSANIQFKSIFKTDIEKPYYALYYNSRLFSKYYDYRELENLAVSPLREKIAGELMAGKLCVIVFLKTGNPGKDDPKMQMVRKSVSASPFSEIIPVVEVSRTSAEEKHFVSMLLNVESDLKDIHEPMVFGIFGRFKALEPLLAKGISEENLSLMIDFLTADCSCLIKDNLPGTDILYTNQWENPVPALVNRILDENPSLQHH